MDGIVSLFTGQARYCCMFAVFLNHSFYFFKHLIHNLNAPLFPRLNESRLFLSWVHTYTQLQGAERRPETSSLLHMDR